MEDKDKVKFEALFEMFASEGWKYFQEDLEESFKILNDNSFTQCDTNDKWQHRRGELFKLQQLISYSAYQRAVFDQLNEEE